MHPKWSSYENYIKIKAGGIKTLLKLQKELLLKNSFPVLNPIITDGIEAAVQFVEREGAVDLVWFAKVFWTLSPEISFKTAALLPGARP